MGVGVQGCQTVDVVEHFRSQDTVQVHRYDDRDTLAENLAGFFEQVAFGVELLRCAHRAVEGEVDTVDGVGVLTEGVEEFARDAQKRTVSQGSRGGPFGIVCEDEFEIIAKS